jgi:Uma2 family endonuclease
MRITARSKGSTMATEAIRLAVDDLEFVPSEREGDRHELIDGELVVTPVPVLKHQIVSGRLYRHLDRHVEVENLGMVFSAPTGVRFTPHTLVIPDLCFVAREHLPSPDAKTIDTPPDLMIEILSPGTRRRDLVLKRALYARFGVQEYWIVDPEAKTVTVLTLKEDRYESLPIADDGRIASRVLPGLELTLDHIFGGLS